MRIRVVSSRAKTRPRRRPDRRRLDRQFRLLAPWPATAVTVLGDAIHNMTPVGGLGANSALRDAAAVLWLRTSPQHVDEVGAALTDSPYVRYAAATIREYQLITHLAVPTMAVLHQSITRSPWSALVTSTDSALIIDAPKRSGVVAGR